jgi:hypothetical protein
VQEALVVLQLQEIQEMLEPQEPQVPLVMVVDRLAVEETQVASQVLGGSRPSSSSRRAVPAVPVAPAVLQVGAGAAPAAVATPTLGRLSLADPAAEVAVAAEHHKQVALQPQETQEMLAQQVRVKQDNQQLQAHLLELP